MMIFLLKNGALPNIKEVISNKLPITIAIEIKNKEAIEILNQYLDSETSSG